jgi:hypothetical protein
MASESGQKSLQLIDKSTMSQPDRRYWGTAVSAGAPELRYMYSIGLLDLEDLSAVSIPGADPANNYVGRGEPWFTFPIPPSTYNVSEPAATVITPTQDGGKFVESQGNIFKDIQIAGTVGLRPNPASNELIPGLAAKTGVSLTLPQTPLGKNASFNDERGLKPSEITGLDDITFLRNIFRGYWDLKKQNALARRYVMVWLYAKESEWYVVEPISFQTQRDSANPMSWNYAIQLRTLYRFDTTIQFPEDRISALQKISNFFKAVGQAIKDLTKAINQIVSAIEFAIQLPFNLLGDFLNLATGLLSSLANLRNVGKIASNIKRKALRDLANRAQELGDLVHKIKYGEAAGDKRVFGSEKDGYVAPAPTDDNGAALSILRDDVRRALTLIARTAKRLHALDRLFQQSRQVQVTDYANRYLEDGESQSSSDSPLDPTNVTIPGTATEVEVSDTIRGMAKRYLGSEEFWKMLAILNDLKYPYIATSRSAGVLQHGDKMLIPRAPDRQQDIVNSTQETLTDAGMEALSPVVKKYGRDLQLSSPGASAGADLVDIEVSQRGDLATIEGVPNVNQAMQIKFGTERGDLPIHPEFGAAFPVGTKLLLGRIQEFAVNTRRTLLSDDRVDSVEKLRIFSEADVLQVNAHVKLKQSNTKLPINFAVRRG